MVIAVDFDGTIVEHKYPSIGKEIPFAFDTLKKLVAAHHKIILWTVREGKYLDEAVEFCRSNGLEFYAVNAELPGEYESKSEPRKIRADIYIDDRNIGGVPDWALIYRIIMEHLTYADLLQGEIPNPEEDTETPYGFHSGTFGKTGHRTGSSSSRSHHKHHSHRHRKGFFRWVAERCYAARSRYDRY